MTTMQTAAAETRTQRRRRRVRPVLSCITQVIVLFGYAENSRAQNPTRDFCLTSHKSPMQSSVQQHEVRDISPGLSRKKSYNDAIKLVFDFRGIPIPRVIVRSLLIGLLRGGKFSLISFGATLRK